MLAKSYPILFRILLCVVFPFLVLVGFGYKFIIQSLPVVSGTTYVDGISSKVEITRDDNAVVHIVGQTDEDAFYALGYVHAQERMWQMEYQRRLGQGRLSEVLGADSLDMDLVMRTSKIYKMSKIALEHLEPKVNKALNAYVKGINTWIEEGHTLPIEFQLLDFQPEPWAPEDSILQIKLLARNLDFNYRRELVNEVLINEVGIAKARQLMPNYEMKENQNSKESHQLTERLVEPKIIDGLFALSEMEKLEYRIGGKGLGSNGWVVSGQHTKSGKPILANDPHLNTDIPSVWYLAEIKGSKIHVTGATFPGVPFVILGHNQSIAWGGTALGADVQDLYIERINPHNPDQYEVDGQWVDMEIETEWVKVKSEFPTALTEPMPLLKWEVRSTRHGPLISDAIELTNTPLAMKWNMTDQKDGTFSSFMAINYAQNWDEFTSALSSYVSPTLNFLYADTQGNIGSIAAGKIPVRKNGDGQLPVPGWTQDNEWTHYIPSDQLPQQFNPASGYISSANNKNHGDDYPYLISNNWEPDYRNDRISQVLESFITQGKKIVTEDFQQLQGDVVSLQAQEFSAYIKTLKPENDDQRRLISRLENWDGSMGTGSAEAMIYQTWFRYFNRTIFNDELRGDLLHPERLDLLFNFAETLNPIFVRQLIANQNNPNIDYQWCDQNFTKKIESCDDIALFAFDKAADDLLTLTGEDITWGELHSTKYSHRGFTSVQLLDSIFNRQVVTGGDGFTVNVGGWLYTQDEGYQNVSNATYRHVFDLADWNDGGFINNTGQSGNLFSDYYDDNIEKHQNLDLLPTHFGQKQLPNAARPFILLPKKPNQQEGRK